MQNRKAIVIPMGMLLKVNLNAIIGALTVEAKKENPEFDLNKVLGQAMGLCEQFNEDKISEEKFLQEIFSLLGITKMPVESFWKVWNSALAFDGMLDNIKMLQQLSDKHDVTFYPVTDSNIAHLKHIKSEAKGIELIINGSEATLNGLPLFATCLLKKNRLDVNKFAVEKIKSKAFNHVSDSIVLMGDPSNQPAPLQARAKAEVDKMTTWCNENAARVELHTNANKNTLENTLHRMLGIELVQEQRLVIGNM